MHAVIAFRASHPERVRNLAHVLTRLDRARVPVVLVEQEYPVDESWFQTAPLFPTIRTHVVARVIAGTLTERALFQKTALYNMGLALVPPDEQHIVFHDADVFVPPGPLRYEIYDLLDAKLGLFDVVSPYDKLCYLTARETEDYLADRVLPQPDGRETFARHSFLLTGGIVGFRRVALTRLGGWPAGFAGWGHEDRAMAAMVRAEGLTTHRMPNIGYHLDHPHTERTPTIVTLNLQRAVAIERGTQ